MFADMQSGDSVIIKAQVSNILIIVIIIIIFDIIVIIVIITNIINMSIMNTLLCKTVGKIYFQIAPLFVSLRYSAVLKIHWSQVVYFRPMPLSAAVRGMGWGQGVKTPQWSIGVKLGSPLISPHCRQI